MIYLLMITTLIVFAISVSLYIFKSRITSPLPLHLIPWALVMLLGIINYDDYIDFPEQSYYALLLWLLIIIIIYFVADINNYKHAKATFLSNKSFVCGRYWIFVIPVSIYTIYEIYVVGTGGPASFLLNLRLANTMEDYPGPKFLVLTAVYPIIMAMFAIICVAKSSRLTFYSVLFWMVLFCIGTMGKFAVVTPVLVYLITHDVKYKISNRKLFLFAGLLFVGVMGVHFSRMAANDSATLASVLGVYIYSPILAFSHLTSFTGSNPGEYTFRFIYAFFSKLNLISEQPVDTILEYVNVPVPTNVYTMLQPFYHDYGFYGVIFGALIYGMFYAGFYSFAIRGSTVALLIYAVLAISSVTSFFAETLITNLSGNIKLILSILILWQLTVKRKIKQLQF
ncbi:oligosaccharide repeat unit polymerase [Bacillus amyloliquefaciens]|nr:oligosaccharide repeat unit polymerase [Bacillus amyloliquefaciens]